jgi:polysaccharide deacetylase family protein (PEP-CTERM system associated)
MSSSAPHILTVDVEEWFHICGAGGALAFDHWAALPSRVVETTDRLLDLCDRTGARATFFILGYVAERHPALVQRIIAAGHEIATHGHLHRRVYELTPAEFEADLSASVAALEACGAGGISGFRAPEWSVNDRSLWALDVLARRGFTFDSSMAPLRVIGNPAYPVQPHHRSTDAGMIAEFPPAVTRRLGFHAPFGGGWGLRMSRPRAVLAQLDERARSGLKTVLWVHPWEIDDDPPAVRLNTGKWFAHYFRLDGFAARLETILRGATFGPMGPLAAGMAT